jgi:hypothetical protein
VSVEKGVGFGDDVASGAVNDRVDVVTLTGDAVAVAVNGDMTKFFPR